MYYIVIILYLIFQGMREKLTIYIGTKLKSTQQDISLL